MKISQEQLNESFSTFRSNPTTENMEAYKKLDVLHKEQKDAEKLETFKNSINKRNKYYTLMNELMPKVVDVLNNYTESLSTNDGSVRKSLLKLLPVHENIRYYVKYNNLEVYYNDGRTFNDSMTMYKYEGVYKYSPCTLIDFETEYSKAKDYLTAYNNAVESLGAHKINMYFKDYLNQTNHISKIYF